MRGFTLFAIVLGLSWASTARGADQPALDPPGEQSNTATEDLLQRKLAELAALQDEVRDLRRTAGRPAEIVLQVQVVELSRTKMRDLGIDINAASPTKAADRKAVAGLMAMLKREGAVKILSEPSLLVSDGRPAHFFNGGEVSAPIKRADGRKTAEIRKIGTQIDVVANLLGGQRVHLNFRASQSEMDPALTRTVERIDPLGLRVRELDTALEMRLGQTAVLGTGTEGNVVTVVDPAGGLPVEVIEEFEMLFLVTPQLTEEAK
jgi:Flp pilus assembly secretin CpaC